MRLLQRDAEILGGVARFGSLTTAQIRTLYFHDLKSISPSKVVLKRLVDQGALARVPVRLPSNERGGSPMGCYQIGKAVWRSFYPAATYRPVRDQMKLWHSLAVADVYIATVQASRDLTVDILEHQVETDAWVSVAGAELHPDLFLDLGLRAKHVRRRMWIEVDNGTERQRHITEKIERYVYAYNHSGDYTAHDSFPDVVFLARNPERVKELSQIVARCNAPDGLVSVAALESFPGYLLS